MSEAKKWRDLALRLGNSIQAFRNLHALGKVKNIRGTPEYRELCLAWESLDDVLEADPRFKHDLDSNPPRWVEIPADWIRARHAHVELPKHLRDAIARIASDCDTQGGIQIADVRKRLLELLER